MPLGKEQYVQPCDVGYTQQEDIRYWPRNIPFVRKKHVVSNETYGPYTGPAKV